MLIPNRVGEHVLLEIAADNVKNPITNPNFANVVGGIETFEVQISTATLNSPVAAEVMSLDNTPALGTNESFAWGRFIDGSHEFDIPQQYTIAAFLQLRLSDEPGDVMVALNVGRLDDGETLTVNHTAAVNAVSHAKPLPINITQHDRSVYASYQGSFIDGKFDTLQAFSTRPLGVFWSLQNEGGAAAINIGFMKAYIAIFNYKEALEVFDPLR